MIIKKENIIPLLLFLLVFVLINTGNVYEPISLGSTLLLIFFSAACVVITIISIFKRKYLEKKIFQMFLYFVLFVMLTAVLSFNGESVFLGLKRAFQILCVLSLVYIFYIWGASGKTPTILDVSTKFFIILVIFNVTYSLVTKDFSGFSSFLKNPNAFGMWITVISLVLFGNRNNQSKKYLIFFFFLSVYLIFISSSRSSLLAFLTGLGILLMPNNFIKSTFFKILFLLFLFLISYWFIYFIVYFDLGVYNEIVKETMGKNLKSGRHVIWPGLIDAISIRPWFGWGSSTTPLDVLNITLSSHNAYLQTILQVGFVGFILFLIILIKIYYMIYKVSNIKYFKLALSVFSALIITQSFEVTIFQNNLAISYTVWAVIGLVLGHDNYEKKFINV